ncbi:MAG: DNA-3-methyladenine glycosylase 2 family protein [Thermoleophilia bacterium]|nr:DNA-3-methyladenine glycosylase 2 family protein [Thermoleophilia bacterium]
MVRTLAPLQRGRHDCCQSALGGRAVWRTARLASGTVVARIVQDDDQRVSCSAWGEGASQFVDELPTLLGDGDAPEDLDCTSHRLLAKLQRGHPWLRMPRSGLVFEAIVGSILEQRVTVQEALAGRRWLYERYGDATPAAPRGMPAHLRLAPSPATWLAIPSWDWHRAGVDVHRAATIRRCAEVAARLDETISMERTDGMRRMRAVAGVGVWTLAETWQRSHGDADLVSFGDVHVARFVGYALTGESTDHHGMQELLEPWRGHRQRVVRLLQLGASLGAVQTAPRIPKARPRQHLRF